jgi:hypothetical protein
VTRPELAPGTALLRSCLSGDDKTDEKREHPGAGSASKRVAPCVKHFPLIIGLHTELREISVRLCLGVVIDDGACSTVRGRRA